VGHRRRAQVVIALIVIGGAATLGAACVGEATTGAPSASEAACEDLLVQERCFDCLEAGCCEQLRACVVDADADGCTACLQGDGDACLGSPTAVKLYGCVLGECSDACADDAPGPRCDLAGDAPSAGSCVELGERATCNPVTNEGCQGDEAASCDYDAGWFRCYAPPNDRELCEPCGGDDGFCAPGSTCYQSVAVTTEGLLFRRACARTCCDDADCGGGVCASYVEADGSRVGACLERGESP
jgi:hypothetical protein